MKSHKGQMRATRSPSSSSDEVLIVTAKRKPVQNNRSEESYESLRIQKLVTCEFCEEVFLNRYDHIVHNASHIIIPLSKGNILQCPQCSEQCISHRKLRKHMKKCQHSTKTHHNQFNALQETIEKWESRLESLESTIIEQESNITHLESGIVRPMVIHLDSNRYCEAVRSYTEISDDLNSDKIIEISDSDDDIVMKVNGDLKDDIKNVNKIEKKEIECFRNRFKFEEDILDEGCDIKGSDLMQDLTAECKINMDLNPPWWALNMDDSIHYDELVTPQKVNCRFCGRKFSNRYKAILHETLHIEIKKGRPYVCRYCDWYISDNIGYLSTHIKRKHTESARDSDDDKTIRKTKPAICKICNLKYISKHRHINNYHRNIVLNDNLLKYEENKEIAHIKSHEQDGGQQNGAQQDGGQQNSVQQDRFYTKIEKVCDMCCSFLKDKSNTIRYTIVGEHCEVGTRLRCDKCSKECFNLNMVQCRYRRANGGWKPGPKKNVTNMDRLKNIQNRFKMMKSL